MSDDIQQLQQTELTLEGLTKELDSARKIINGMGSSGEMLSDNLFPILSEYFPDQLDLFKRTANINQKMDLGRVELAEAVGIDVLLWPDERERNFLLIAGKSGKLEEAMKVLTIDHERRIRDGTSGERKAGF